MLKGIKQFLSALKKDKEQVEKDVEKATTKEERQIYKVWIFSLTAMALGFLTLTAPHAFVPFGYCLYKAYKWMRGDNAAK